MGFLKAIDDAIDKTIESFRKLLKNIYKTVSRTSKKIDKVKSSVGENIDSKVQEINNMLTETKQELNGKLQTIQDDIAGVKTTVDGCCGAMSEKFNAMDTRFNGVDGRFNAVDTQLSTLTENVRELLVNQTNKLTELNNEIGTLKKDITEKNRELDALHEKSADLAKQLDDEKRAHLTAETDCKSRIQQFEQEQVTLKNTVERLTDGLTVAEKALQDWQDAVSYYGKVRATMRNCATFKNLLEKRGLNDDTDIGLIAFVRELGKTVDFLKAVHQAALDFKNAQKDQGQDPELMRDDEIEVYEALNECYRHIWGIKFNVFTTPVTRKPLGESFDKIDFDIAEAFNLKDPNRKDLPYIKGIYVPLLLSEEGHVLVQSYVKAGTY